MNQEFYSDFERGLMKRHDCRIIKVVVCMDGAAKLAGQSALDEAVSKMVGDDPYIEKRGVFVDAFTAEVICFRSEEGMRSWIKEFPGDIRFIEKDWGAG
jgi:hypothetical protein